MKALVNIGVFLCITILFSCDEDPYVPHNLLKFSPCRTTQLWAIAGCMCYGEVNGVSYYGFDDLSTINNEGNLEISSKEYLLAISTAELSDSIFHTTSVYLPVFEIRDSSFVDGEHIELVEEQLAQSYRKMEEQNVLKSAEINLENIEYRTNGIENIRISASCKLWGVAPDNILNDKFFITKYNPEAIVSSKTDKLLFGFTEEEDMPKGINEWLELEPYAPPQIRLMFNEVPPELPCDVQFFVEMTTSDGDVLSDSTQIVHITKND